MLENKQNIAYDDPSKTFLGVRFVLRGFDSVKEDKVRRKLLEGGGTDAVIYGPDCNHVIIDKLVYDDPICVAARRDGKILVTGLWVDHSFDVGMPVNPTNVLYWPMRDLNGIPGAESLVVCLTGYLRHDRDDIMTMVALMGANFSKPLMASKVTHLVCYKFEGEKYELAKKLKKIKLVNHYWLEDCLKAWELLPEADYAKSAYELEMVAEAKDSEEETEDIASIDRRKKTVSPENTKTFHQPPLKQEVSRNSSYLTASESFANVGDTNKIQMTPRKEIDRGKASISRGTHDRHLLKPSSSVTSPEKKSSELPSNILDGITIAENGEHAIPSASKSAKKTPADADSSKLSSKSAKLSVPSISERIENYSGSPLASNVNKLGVSGGFGMLLERDHDGTDSHVLRTPPKRTLLHLDEGLTKSSPSKREATVSRGSSRSPISSPQKSVRNGLTAKRMEVPVSATNVTSHLREDGFDMPVEKHLAQIDPDGVKTPLKGIRSHLDEGQTGSLTNKRKSAVSRSSSKSVMLSHSPPKSMGSRLAKKRKEVAVSATNGTSHLREEVSGGFDMPMEKSLPGVDPDGVKLPLNGTPLHLDQGKTGSLTNKRKKSVSRGSSGSPISSHLPKSSVRSGLATKMMELPVSGGLVGDTSAANASSCLRDEASLSPKESENKQDCDDQALQHSRERLTNRALSNLDMGNVSSMVEKMDDQADLNISKADCSGTQLKPKKKKMLSRKTLGVRPVGKGRSTKQKGLVNNLQNAVLQNECINHSNGAVAMEDIDNANVSEKVAVTSPTTNGNGLVDNETKAPDDNGQNELDFVSDKEDSPKVEASHSGKRATLSKKQAGGKTMKVKKGVKSVGVKKSNEAEKTTCSSTTELPESKSTGDGADRKTSKGKKRLLTKSKANNSKDSREEMKNDKTKSKQDEEKSEETVVLAGRTNKKPSKKLKSSADEEKENIPATDRQLSVSSDTRTAEKTTSPFVKTPLKDFSKADKNSSENSMVGTEPAWFILSGHRLQRKEFQHVIRRLKGKVCRDSHNWSYQATHFIVPDPVRRTEKFFAAAASGCWILKTDYLTSSNEEGRFLPEEPYEWNKKCLTEDGAINLEAPRKWRLLRERTGHGAFYGMRIVIYGECIAPPLDTLKRVVKAGDGTILATSPPYTRFLKSGIDFAVVSPGMPRVDIWVQEFLRHEVPCIVADYLVEYVCKPGYPLERHVVYNTHAWAQKSLDNLVSRLEGVFDDTTTPGDDDLACNVCGARDRGDKMLICGDETGSHGCGVGVHIDCLDPPLEGIPEEDWYCGECSRRRATETASPGSKKRASKSKK